MKKRRARKYSPKHATKRKYSKLASACDRTEVSDRAAAITASSVLHDKAGCSETNPELVIDHKLEEVKKSEIVIKRHMQQLKKVFLVFILMVEKTRHLHKPWLGENAESILCKKSMY